MISMILGLLGIAAAPIGAAVPGWEYQEITDQMTDAKLGVAIVEGPTAGLIVKCDEIGPGSLYLSIVDKKNFYGKGRSPFRNFKYRVDGTTPTDLIGYHDNRMITVINLGYGQPGRQMLQYIASGNRLVVEATSYDNHTYQNVIDISNGAKVIERVARTCGDSEWIN